MPKEGWSIVQNDEVYGNASRHTGQHLAPEREAFRWRAVIAKVHGDVPVGVFPLLAAGPRSE